MTTIACNREEMAADSRFHEDGVTFSCMKLYRIGQSVFGIAGETRGEFKFLAWLRAGRPDEARPTFEGEMDEFYALELNASGIFYWDKHLYGVEAVEPCLAIGTGGDFARAFMATGMTPGQAVQQVCDRGLDYATGGPVHVKHL